jgi:MSHA pilin protein MshA
MKAIRAQSKPDEKGFTLIELVVVIVILGILAATALPKFIDLSGDAKTAAVQGAAGALTSYAAINYSAAMARGTTGTGVVNLSGAASAAAALTASMAGWDTKFVIGTEANCSGSSAGATATAKLTYSGGTATVNSATATIVCTG